MFDLVDYGRTAIAAPDGLTAEDAAALNRERMREGVLFLVWGTLWAAIPATLAWGALWLAAGAQVALNEYLVIALIAAPALAAPNALVAWREAYRSFRRLRFIPKSA